MSKTQTILGLKSEELFHILAPGCTIPSVLTIEPQNERQRDRFCISVETGSVALDPCVLPVKLGPLTANEAAILAIACSDEFQQPWQLRDAQPHFRPNDIRPTSYKTIAQIAVNSLRGFGLVQMLGGGPRVTYAQNVLVNPELDSVALAVGKRELNCSGMTNGSPYHSGRKSSY